VIQGVKEKIQKLNTVFLTKANDVPNFKFPTKYDHPKGRRLLNMSMFSDFLKTQNMCFWNNIRGA
jgi:hypothetical protein